MKKIMFSDKYGLTQAVLKGRKTQTRRMPFWGNLGLISLPPRQLIAAAKYNIGEEVAIAQRYEDMAKDDDFFRFFAEKRNRFGASHIRERMPQQDVCQGRPYAAPHPHYQYSC